MRIGFPWVLSLAYLNLITCVAATEELNSRAPPAPRGCDFNAKGPRLSDRQSAAIKDFGRLYLAERDAQAAFDKYIPGPEYINHSPAAAANSTRQFSIDFLTAFFAANPNHRYTNIKAWAGEGLGTLHYRSVTPLADGSVRDTANLAYFRFKGTCLVEHWPVVQTITGNEANPIAFF